MSCSFSPSLCPCSWNNVHLWPRWRSDHIQLAAQREAQHAHRSSDRWLQHVAERWHPGANRQRRGAWRLHHAPHCECKHLFYIKPFTKSSMDTESDKAQSTVAFNILFHCFQNNPAHQRLTLSLPPVDYNSSLFFWSCSLKAVGDSTRYCAMLAACNARPLCGSKQNCQIRKCSAIMSESVCRGPHTLESLEHSQISHIEKSL